MKQRKTCIAGWFTAILGILWSSGPAFCQTVQDSTDRLAQRTPYESLISGEAQATGAESLFVPVLPEFLQPPPTESIAGAIAPRSVHESHRIPLTAYWDNGHCLILAL